jgi:uncharacterized UPF0160 family protein
MDNDMKNRVEEVIGKISLKYPKLIIGYEYDGECYFIWHNDEYLEYMDKEFRSFTGKLLDDYFFENDIFNVYMTFDSDEALKKFSESIIQANGIFMDYKDNGISDIRLEVNQTDILESLLFKDDIQIKNLKIQDRAEINVKNNEFNKTFSEVA